MRITYDFPGKKKEVLRVIRIVGIQWTIEHLMMMWETSPDRTLKERWFDFKYLRGLNPLGLNRPAVFPEAILKQVFALYREKADIVDFP